MLQCLFHSYTLCNYIVHSNRNVVVLQPENEFFFFCFLLPYNAAYVG